MGHADDEFPVNLDTGDNAPNTITGMLWGVASQLVPQGSSSSFLMKPEEIASVPGLPDYARSRSGAFGDYADQRVRQDVSARFGGVLHRISCIGT